MRVIVTGASGVLGTAVYAAFKAADHNVIGLANSRSTEELKQLDLLDDKAVDKFFQESKAELVIHCAAERRPDVAEKDPEHARELNVGVPEHLARLSKELKFKLIYISTDYVFDGTSPPYTPSSPTNPLNLYGRTKLDGELAVLGVTGANISVLRVPVLYGPAPNNSDTAVNILVDVVQDQSGKKYKMDHYATRFPTNVQDIASFLVLVTTANVTLLPIMHFSAPEPFTKYEMCLILAAILKLPHDHIIPDAEEPKGEAATTRPRNCQLDTRDTEALVQSIAHADGGLGCCLFEEWWTSYLGKE